MKMWMATAGFVCGLALLVGVAPAAAQDEDPGKFVVGSEVIIQGCVREAKTRGAYVLTHTQEWPVPNSPNGKYGPRSYWVDKDADEFRSRVGQTVQITATIIDLERSKIDMTPGWSQGGTLVGMERPGRDVETSPQNAGLPDGRDSGSPDEVVTLLKLRVHEFLTVMSTCLPES
jgi:hypothetical protein